MYDIVPKKGDSYRVNKVHVLSLVMTPTGKRFRNRKPLRKPKSLMDNTIQNISVESYLSRSRTFKHCAKGYRAKVYFQEREVPLEPYFLGLWLGDGDSDRASITSDDIEVIEAVYSLADKLDMQVTVSNTNNGKAAGWSINPGKTSGKGMRRRTGTGC